MIPTYGIRVEATHGGTPFVFYAYIITVNGTTTITASRPYPADADNGTFSVPDHRCRRAHSGASLYAIK